MNKLAKAQIFWLTEMQGGRQQMPEGKYVPIIRQISPILNPLPWQDKNGAWGLIVDNKKFLSDNETISNIRYLFHEKAPNNLIKDMQFELYEGSKLVARGKVLENRD